MQFIEFPTYDAVGITIAYRLELQDAVIEKG
jgi:hypothetical protein